MNIGDPFAQPRPLFKLFGAILVLLAVAKLFGVNINFGGSTADDALVGIGLLHI